MKFDLTKIKFNHEGNTFEEALNINEEDTQECFNDILKVFLSIGSNSKPSKSFEDFLKTIDSEKKLIIHLLKLFWDTYERVSDSNVIEADASILEDEELSAKLAANFDGTKYEA